MIKERLNRLKDNKSNDQISQLSYYLCKTFGWDYWTLMEQPLPFIWKMLNQIIQEAEMKTKALKKGTKK